MNRKLLLIAGLFLFFSLVVFSQNQKATIVDYQISCHVNLDNELYANVKRLIRVDSPEGRRYATVRVYYDEMSPVKSLSVSILDKNKKRSRRIKKSEISDYSDLSGYLYTDNRYKEIKALSNEYPYYILVNYQQEYHGFFSLPSWYPQQGGNITCLNTRYQVSVPHDYKIHYKFYNFNPAESLTENKNGTVTYAWEAKNIDPVNITEPFSPPLLSLISRGKIVPESFIMGGLAGNLCLWKDFGNWISKLIEGLDDLPDEEILKVHQLTDTLQSDREKAKILYHYMQKDTRYVGVFEGMGGWKPYDARYVCNNKYGDCKALTNYMKALLKEAGVTAYYCLIKAGEDNPDIDTAFVSNQFNHVVLYLPLLSDTLWLECTDHEIPFGYWGTFTQGKHALVCNFDKSYLIKTPELANDKFQNSLTAVVTINNDSLLFNSTRIVTGKEYEIINHKLKTEKSPSLINACYRMMPYSNFTIEEVTYFSNPLEPECFTEQAKITVGNHIQKFNNEMILRPFYKLLNTNHTLAQQRENDVYIAGIISKTDSIVYRIPENYRVEYFPKDTIVSSHFGKFEQKYTLLNNKLITLKSIVLKQNRYPKKDYPNFRNFLNVVYKLENQTILFKKQ